MGQQRALDPDTGLRKDGRRPRELRRIRCQVGVLDTADGSAIFEMGNTQVRPGSRRVLLGPKTNTPLLPPPPPVDRRRPSIAAAANGSPHTSFPQNQNQNQNQYQNQNQNQNQHPKQVIASVFGPYEPSDAGGGPSPLATSSESPVRCDYAVAAFALPSGRRAGAGAAARGPDRRSQELARLVRAAVEQAVVTEALGPPGGRCRVDVSVQVLQSDGGAAACAVNAALLALAHAGVPLRGLVAACAASRPPGCAVPLLDPSHEETAAAAGGAGGSGGDVVVAVQVGGGRAGGMAGGDGGGVGAGGRLVMVSAEGRLSLDEVDACVSLSGEGCRAVAGRMRQALLAHARGRGAPGTLAAAA